MDRDDLLRHDRFFFQALMDADAVRPEELLAEDFVRLVGEVGLVVGRTGTAIKP